MIAISTPASSRSSFFRIQDRRRGKIVVVAGYQGVSYRKKITTLGRGGSDTTAVAMAQHWAQEYCEICSDVDGVYTADPSCFASQANTPYFPTKKPGAGRVGGKGFDAQAVSSPRKGDFNLRQGCTDPFARGRSVRGRHSGFAEYGPHPPGSVVGIASEKRF